MDVELSRRAGRVMHYSPIVDHTVEERRAFIAALEAATDFSSLPKSIRTQITQAEANWRKAEAASIIV